MKNFIYTIQIPMQLNQYSHYKIQNNPTNDGLFLKRPSFSVFFNETC